MMQSVQSVFSKYVTFSGRARRSEYWWFVLFYFIVDIVVSIIDQAIGNQALGGLVFLVFLLPSLAVTVRRLHDTGRVGWWIFLGLIPLVGAIILIVFNAQDSQPGTNQYGPSPKELAGGASDPGYPQQGWNQGGYQQPPTS